MPMLPNRHQPPLNLNRSHLPLPPRLHPHRYDAADRVPGTFTSITAKCHPSRPNPHNPSHHTMHNINDQLFLQYNPRMVLHTHLHQRRTIPHLHIRCIMLATIPPTSTLTPTATRDIGQPRH